MAKRIKAMPKHSELVSYGGAVAGHDGTLVDESGEFFFKPVHQQEIDFYESAFKDHLDFAEVMPPYRGVLTKGEEKEDEKSEESPISSSSSSSSSDEEKKEPEKKKPAKEWVPGNRTLDTHKYLVLENASKGYTHPNILDTKLGVRLWADDAPQAKKDRFDKISEATTHKKFGFRVAGMRIYQPGAQPAPAVSVPRKPEYKVKEDYKVYDKDFGRSYVNDDNLRESIRGFIFNKQSGITDDLAKAVCTVFVRDLERIRDALEKEESRMYSASCLFVLEGEGKALMSAIEEQNKKVDRRNAGDGGDSEDEEAVEHRICGVQLIDFAHARWTPGEGPDENSLKGVRCLLEIFKEFAA